MEPGVWRGGLYNYISNTRNRTGKRCQLPGFHIVRCFFCAVVTGSSSSLESSANAELTAGLAAVRALSPMPQPPGVLFAAMPGPLGALFGLAVLPHREPADACWRGGADAAGAGG